MRAGVADCAAEGKIQSWFDLVYFLRTMFIALEKLWLRLRAGGFGWSKSSQRAVSLCKVALVAR
jgi:hypothetical protein